MKSKDLLSQLSTLEAKLGDFSFEELSSQEASHLKKSFQAFKKDLESRIWGETPPTKTNPQQPSSAEEVARLIGNVSHEIRTPLNGIIGFTNMLKEGKLTKQQHSYVDGIQSASNTLLTIVSELLHYSKTSMHLNSVDISAFNFRGLIKDILYLGSGLIQNQPIQLEIDIDAKIPDTLIGDAAKLSQILLNLLGNAIKFVEKGEVRLGVHIDALDTKNITLAFVLSDTGIGIAEENLKTIFTAFKQAEAHTQQKYGGSGLGLNIVKQLVERLKGEISVDSTLGVGTTFTVNLPFEIGQKVVPIENKTSEDVLIPHIEAIKGMQILVFEDNTLNQKLIEQRLKSWGCNPHITANAIVGMNILKQHVIDLVLMDLRMPQVNGFEMTKRIRASEHNAIRDLPIIALSADFTLQDKEQCKANKIDDFILKPYSAEELLLKLSNHKKSKTTSEIRFEKKENTTNQPDAVDLSEILAECMGDVEVLEELIKLYEFNALEFIGKAKLLVKNIDFDGLEFAAHKMKSGLAMMQTFNLRGIMEEIHKICRTTKDINHIEYLYHCFLEAYPPVIQQMELELKKIKNSK